MLYFLTILLIIFNLSLLIIFKKIKFKNSKKTNYYFLNLFINNNQNNIKNLYTKYTFSNFQAKKQTQNFKKI